MLILNPHSAGSGYFQNDNRASGGTLEQSDVQTCTHCQAVVLLHKPNSPYGYCRKCDNVLCAHCAKKAETEGCTPFKATIDRLLEENYRRKVSLL